MTLLY